LAATAASLVHAQDSAQPRFAWPDDLVARVQIQKSRTRQVEGQADVTSGMRSQYLMRAQRRGDQHLVSFSDLQLDAQPLAAMPVEQRSLMEVLARAALPSYVVSSSGDFVALENIAGFRSAMRSALERLLPEPSARSRLDALMETVLSDAVVQSLAQTDWNYWVGAWAGTEQAFDIGEEYVSATQSTMPVVNSPITQHTRFNFARKLPCEREGKSQECVEILATTTPDEAETRAAVTAFTNRLMPAGTAKDALRLESLNLVVKLALVTEVGTLIPHRYKLSKTTVMSGTEAGKPMTRRQVEDTEQTFQYKRMD
jgi:hypothetical protein